MMSAKMATAGLLKVQVFWSEGYDVIISVQDIDKIISCDSNYIVDVVIWPTFVNYSIFMRSYHNLNFMRTWS